MKKTILLIAILFAATVMFAQDNTATAGAELSIGVDAGLPISSDFKETSKFGIGGTAKFAYNFTEVIAVTLQSGYMSFSGKNVDFGGGSFKYPTLSMIPVKVGGRYTVSGGFYLEPQLGFTFLKVKDQDGTTGFTYAFNAGYKMTPGIDVSARYEGISKDGNASFIGLRLAYNFSLSQ